MRPEYKVWIEIKRSAVRANIRTFRVLLDKKTKLYAVVKSNAYGHGLLQFSSIADESGIDGFCVDSVIEGIKLRSHGITKPILVLGYTLPGMYASAAKHDITITISSKESLIAWHKAKEKPRFHIKIDTGMHRQGFQSSEVPGLLKKIQSASRRTIRQPADEIRNYLKGIYTHFAMAKNRRDTAFTKEQYALFESACALFERVGFSDLMRHASATGGALLGMPFHADMVRVGIGLYGIWPSAELERQLSKTATLLPALSLHSVVSEVKTVAKGEGIGYDLTERVKQATTIAIVPIGYWHGIPRAASSIGTVLVGKRKARIIGRVSMDMLMIDVTGIPCRTGSEVMIMPADLAKEIDASPYEVVTRLNPLIHKAIT